MKKKLFIALLFGAILLSSMLFLFIKSDQFGNAPSGERLAEMGKSSNFKNGKFENLNPTPELTNGATMLGLIYDQFFKKAPRRKPTDTIPSIQSNLLEISGDRNVLVWFGHSSYWMQIDGKSILMDPVFSGNASPVPGTNRSFSGTDIYSASDLPGIDYLFISHDHYDHLDLKTIKSLKGKVKKVICGLGVGSHFEKWGYNREMIIETDWYEKIELEKGLIMFSEPARHFSGRGINRNNTLWQSYVLQTPTLKIYMGGDGGYDTHFLDIGKRHGPIDLAILDNGQYDSAWQLIHTLPNEVLMAAKDLQAKRLFPVHSSKFVLANHPWDEPLQKITELNQSVNIALVTPMIGEIVNLDDSTQSFQKWWADVK